jgi:hypothetical protein
MHYIDRAGNVMMSSSRIQDKLIGITITFISSGEPWGKWIISMGSNCFRVILEFYMMDSSAKVHNL